MIEQSGFDLDGATMMEFRRWSGEMHATFVTFERAIEGDAVQASAQEPGTRSLGDQPELSLEETDSAT